MKIGELKTMSNEDGSKYYKGQITNYALNAKIEIYETSKRTQDSPDLMVKMKSPIHGGVFQAGIGWKGVSRNGVPYMQLVLEIPDVMDREMRLVCFEEAAGYWDINQSRDLKQPQPAQEQEAA